MQFNSRIYVRVRRAILSTLLYEQLLSSSGSINLPATKDKSAGVLTSSHSPFGFLGSKKLLKDLEEESEGEAISQLFGAVIRNREGSNPLNQT